MEGELTEKELQHWFTYHAPTDEQRIQYKTIRNAALTFALVILRNTPFSPDQSVAIRKVREAVMAANASIACGGK